MNERSKEGSSALRIGLGGDYFGEAWPFQDTDINLVNLLQVFTPFSNRHKETAPSDLLNGLRESRIDVVNLAHPLSQDAGAERVLDTVAALEQETIAHIGAGRDQEQARRPAVLDWGSWRVGLLGFQADADPACEHVWSLGKGGALTATAQIKALKEEVDLVIVSLDWGIDDAHEGLARDLVHLGVDLIHGHGRPDLIGLEWIEGTPVLWGLGPYDNEALQLSLHWTDRGVQDLRLRQRGSSQRVEEFLSASRIPSGIKGV